MKQRNILDEISDGKLYDIEDTVKAVLASKKDNNINNVKIEQREVSEEYALSQLNKTLK